MFKNLDKTGVIGVITCVGILILLFIRMQDKHFENQRVQQEMLAQQAAAVASSVAPVEAPVHSAKAQAPSASAAVDELPKPAAPVVSGGAVDPLLPAGRSPRAKGTGRIVELVREGEAVFRIDPAAGVVSTELPGYKRQPEKGEPAEPVVLGHYDYPFLALGRVDGRLDWCALEEKDIVSDAMSVSATRRTADGKLSVTQTWSLSAKGRFELDYTVRFRNLSPDPVPVERLMLDVGALSPMMAGKGEADYGGVATMVPPMTENHCETLPKGKLDANTKALAVLDDPRTSPGEREEARKNLASVHDLSWAAVHTRYFIQAVRASDDRFTFPTIEATMCERMPESPADTEPHRRFRARLALPDGTVPANGEMTWSFTGLVAPKDLNMLSEKGIGLEGMLDMDRFFFGSAAWMGSLSKLFLNFMMAMSRWIPGPWAIGISLILLTVIVKLLLWPLSLKSSRSMKKMQELNPQLKALREKYKSDPAEMYRRQQELFRENHVSQFGGCLPMLIQIPIFFALFNTFRGAIELRQAGFLWASDLSMPDVVFSVPFKFLFFEQLTLNPMALIMVATMLIQQGIMPSNDPSQKRMMMIMSLMFTYFLYSQPSGLTLYMTVNQLLSMLQFWMIRKMDGPASPGGTPSPAGVRDARH